MDSERIKKLRASYEQKNKELASMKAKAEVIGNLLRKRKWPI